MELQIDNIYLINWGKTTSELYILEVTTDAVRATLTKNKDSSGAWYFKTELESKAVRQLNDNLL